MAENTEIVPLTPDNPPPDIEDGSVELFDEVKGREGHTQQDLKNAFFSDAGDLQDLDEVETPEAAAAVATGAEEGEEEGEEVEEGEDPPEPVVPKAKAKAPPAPVDPPPVVEEFKTEHGLRYRAKGVDGKLVDPLAVLGGKGATIEVFADGEFRPIPVEQLPAYLSNALQFNRRQHEIAQHTEQLEGSYAELQTRAAALEAREAEVERFFGDPEYRRQVEAEYERLQTPEGRAEFLEQQLAARNQADNTRAEQGQIRQAAVFVQENVVKPAMAAIAKANPLVSPAVLEAMHAQALGSFRPGDLKLQQGRDGQWYPVNPRAWRAYEGILASRLPAAVAAEQARLSTTVAETRKGADRETRRAQAEREAATTRAELLRNQAGARAGQGGGLPPNRAKPEKAIKTHQQGRAWLSSDEV